MSRCKSSRNWKQESPSATKTWWGTRRHQESTTEGMCRAAPYYILISKVGDERPVTVHMSDESEAKATLAGAAMALWSSSMEKQARLLGASIPRPFFALAKARRGHGFENVKRLVRRGEGYLWADDPATCAALQKNWNGSQGRIH